MNIDAQTRLLGVLGDPVHHSLSPALHNLAMALLAQQGIALNFRYLAFQVRPAQLRQAIQGLAALGAAGCNATIPHKEALLPLMDDLTEEARQVGAVNTVMFHETGRITGHNTDIHGFVAAVTEAFGPLAPGSEAVLLGAGGAARAVLAGLARLGFGRITVVNRDLARAERLLQEVTTTCQPQAVTWSAAPPWLDSCHLLVNTTSVGLHEDSPAMAALRSQLHRLSPSAKVMDIIYGSRTTPLLQEAARLGLPTADGLAMLVHQGAEAFRLWTGVPMPVQAVMSRLRTGRH